MCTFWCSWANTKVTAHEFVNDASANFIIDLNKGSVKIGVVLAEYLHSTFVTNLDGLAINFHVSHNQTW